MKKIDLNYEELTKELLVKYTVSMTRPCVFYNFPVKQGLQTCSVDEILSLGRKQFLSSTHDGSYWSDKPLYAEVQGRRKKLDLKIMFVDNSGDYYVTYFLPTGSNRSGWKTVRTCGNNEFDDYLAAKTVFKDYMKGSSLHNHWVSNGKTLSSLHGDPIDTLFVQVQGLKKFRLIAESMKLCRLADMRQPHKIKYDVNQLKVLGIDVVEIDVVPGTAVYMPAWCFHEVESPDSGINISLSTHYPRVRPMLSFSPFQFVNKVRRFWYPKFVQKKRIQFQLENITQNSIPFFPWFSSHVTNNNFKSDTTLQHEHFLINRKKEKIVPVTNDFLLNILRHVDGFSTLNDIANRTNINHGDLLSAVSQLIEDEFLQILFEAEDEYNYFYQNIEPKNIAI